MRHRSPLRSGTGGEIFQKCLRPARGRHGREGAKLEHTQTITAQRKRLAEEAARAKSGADAACAQDWIDPQRWSEYMGKSGAALYASFTDEELLGMLRTAAAELGHVPSQKEIFCVYRAYIRRRFRNWPGALRAAGLKAPRRTDAENDTIRGKTT